jgi:hypothetical protein
MVKTALSSAMGVGKSRKASELRRKLLGGPSALLVDPLGFDAGDSNLYRYVNNAPVLATDPSGKLVQGTPNAFWQTKFGNTIWELLTDAETYLKKTAPILVKQMNQSKAPQKDKDLFKKQMDFILDNIGNFRVNIGTNFAFLPEGAQATPVPNKKNPGMNLRPYLLFNVYLIDKGKASPYTTTPNADPFKEPTGQDLVLPLPGHLKMDDAAIEVLYGRDAKNYKQGLNANLALNKGLPLPTITLYKKEQVAGLLANELLHVAAKWDPKTRYYHFDDKRGEQQSMQYRWADPKAGYHVYDHLLSFVGKTFSDPTSIDSIWQAFYYAKVKVN